MFYRVVTVLTEEGMGSIDAAKVDWAPDGSGIWIRDTTDRGEDLFISHSRILFIQKKER